MINNDNYIRSTLYLTTALFVCSHRTATADVNTTATLMLFEQARYWHEKTHDDKAIAALEKILLTDSQNTQAMYLLALWSLQTGDSASATKWRNRLAETAPGDPRLQELIHSGTISNTQLAQARNLARDGRTSASLDIWLRVLNGNPPPEAYASEYYMLMASDKSHYQQAIQELRNYVSLHPHDTTTRIVLGKALTWHEETRREGIVLLESLASHNPEAESSLRNALLWLSASSNDEVHYVNWMKFHPDDLDVKRYFNQHITGQLKSLGFDNLNAGKLSEAKKFFEDIIKTEPQDTDALSGLGYVSSRSGDLQAAKQYFSQAVNMGNSLPQEIQQQLKDSLFFTRLDIAKDEYTKGNISQALSLSAPLAEMPGPGGTDAKLFRADVFRRNKNAAEAERILRTVIAENPDNTAALESLYHVLTEQNKSADAAAIMKIMPDHLKSRLKTGMPDNASRQQAHELASRGNTDEAVTLLKQNLSRNGNDAWARLDLARLLMQSGNSEEAISLMSVAFSPRATPDLLFAAALFSSENNAWQQSKSLMSRIPLAKQTPQMKKLVREINYNTQLESARRYLAQGNTVAAQNTLNALVPLIPATPVATGKFAKLLAETGDMSTAVKIVKKNIQSGIKGNAGDYADQIAVLRLAGLSQDIEYILSSPEILASTPPFEYKNIQNNNVISEADSLRQNGRYAEAYDKLINALQNTPDNKELMFAMARLYQSGKMNKEAGIMYDYLMNDDTPSQEARVGAINLALSQGNVHYAVQLADKLKNDNSPERLLLLARIEESQGNNERATTYLRNARSKLTGIHGISDGNLRLKDNPFTARSVQESARSAPARIMPWQVPDETSVLAETVTDFESRQYRMLHDIDTLLSTLNEKTSTWLDTSTQLRSRNGESGTSKLTEFRTPITLSTVPFGNSRLDFSVVPLVLNAGVASGDEWYKTGTNSLFSPSQGKYNDSSDSRQDNGFEFSSGLTGDNYKVDIGTTPVGKELNTLQGGLEWSPRLSQYLSMLLTAERRVLTDSLLSYVGMKDENTGKDWGQVTKNGGKLQLNYDDGDAGLYAGIGGYGYNGENVKSNSSFNASAGVYFRPYQNEKNSLKTGLSVSYMDYARNLSHFSFGQGGYFSPQNYVSIALPVDVFQKFNDNLAFSFGGSLGYQSYTEDRSAYYPTKHDWQHSLEDAVENGLAKEAYYPGVTENGAGYSLHAGFDYKFNKQMAIGGKAGYNSFGDYNESTGALYLKYIMESN